MAAVDFVLKITVVVWGTPHQLPDSRCPPHSGLSVGHDAPVGLMIALKSTDVPLIT